MTDIAALDLTNFREITGGDPDVEKELFTEFFNGTDSQFVILEQTWDKPEKSEDWSHAGHAIKGNAAMLGASVLSEMGKQAQFYPNLDSSVKRTLLDNMKSEYARVKNAIAAISV